MQNFIPQYQQQLRTMGFKVIPVANEFEMNNITVDFNGTPTYFHNQNLNEIYVKQFDIKTGLTTTQKFIKSDNAGREINGAKPESNINLYEDRFNAINDRLTALEEKGGKK
jgi:hypothetical protein